MVFEIFSNLMSLQCEKFPTLSKSRLPARDVARNYSEGGSVGERSKPASQ